MKTRIISGQEAREKLLTGVNVMADAVASTLGPRGQNVAIEKVTPKGDTWDRRVVHDGVTVARSIQLVDGAENMGAQLLLQASQKQVDVVGDGTTVVMILAQAIINECFKLVATGINPMSLRKGLEDGVKLLTQELESMATPINGLKDLKYIATISAEDEELGEMVAKTLNKIGKDGVITVEESKSADTLVDYQEGMQLDRGIVNPYFVTNAERMEAISENTYLLITDKAVTSFFDIQNFLTEFVKTSKNLVIISPEIGGDALPLLIRNKLEGHISVLCIQAPGFGEDQKNILQDIAILTGGKFISAEAGYKFQDLTVDDLGFAEYVTANKDETIIVGGRGKKEDIQNRITSIQSTLEAEDSDYDKERLRARLGKLTNGVAVIRVGGRTEVEMRERRERVLDSVAATRAAMEKGIVSGGETVYLHVRKMLTEEGREVSLTDSILYRSLAKPFKKLISNADLDEVEIALKLDKKGKNWGADVTDGQVKDMIKAGIVDPVLVSINALHNAVSVAIQIVTTNNIIVPILEEKRGE